MTTKSGNSPMTPLPKKRYAVTAIAKIVVSAGNKDLAHIRLLKMLTSVNELVSTDEYVTVDGDSVRIEELPF